jgi:hypothetical protein
LPTALLKRLTGNGSMFISESVTTILRVP